MFAVLSLTPDSLTSGLLQNAMRIIGFADSEVVQLYQLVACVLKLGNIEFQHQPNLDGTDGCKLLNKNGNKTSFSSSHQIEDNVDIYRSFCFRISAHAF